MSDESLISAIADGVVEAIARRIDDIDALAYPDDPQKHTLGRQDAALVGYEGRTWSEPREASPRRIVEMEYTITLLSHSQAHHGSGAERRGLSALEKISAAVDGVVVEGYVLQCRRDRLAGYDDQGGVWHYDITVAAYDRRALEPAR